MGYTLEADYYRNQSATSHMRKMKHDPRTNKPFEQKDITGVSFALFSGNRVGEWQESGGKR